MKIVHIGLTGSFNDGWNYQENNLIHFQRKAGHDVTLITTPFINAKNGGGYVFFGEKYYVDKDGVKICRLHLKNKFINLRISKFRTYKNVDKILYLEEPDIIFIHGCQFLDIKTVAKYAKSNKNVKVYVDNHCDFSNSARNWVSKNIFHKIIWKYCAQCINPHTTKFYGVLPARVDFLVNMYGLPKSKVELLVMGADDEKVFAAKSPKIRKMVRDKYHINENDFLIMTGGKIDAFKTQTLLLMEAVKQIDHSNVKLIVFGSIEDGLKEKIDTLVDGSKIQYIGWIESEQSYAYFAAADLVVFPGRHSIFWEQVVGQGIPMVVKYWEGTTHVDLGGNVEFLKQDSELEIKTVLESIIGDNEKYSKMKKVAVEKGMQAFSYEDISKRSIEVK